jgi:hypothetical protein
MLVLMLIPMEYNDGECNLNLQSSMRTLMYVGGKEPMFSIQLIHTQNKQFFHDSNIC